MKSVRVDTTGELRCWNCGGASFREKRTVRSKMMVGVGSLATKKKMKCHLCDEFNDVGSAKPYKGPASKRRGKKLGTFTNMHGQVVTEPAIRVEVINQAIPQGTLQAIQPTPQPIRGCQPQRGGSQTQPAATSCAIGPVLRGLSTCRTWVPPTWTPSRRPRPQGPTCAGGQCSRLPG